ncbi:MAG: DUF2085 domain-containing protein [Polyangiaceae bacterium]|jgi:uncharacterized membrane protein|nr:DUF2085 domain-containing protein [Polyangiaceae bacterium]
MSTPADRGPPAWGAIAARSGGALLAIAPFLPPLLLALGAGSLAVELDGLWAPFCHRLPERSLFLLGAPLPLCSRCLGLVVGLGAGLAAAWPYAGLRVLRWAVSFGLAFLFVELTTQDLGWHPVFHPTRLLSGLLVAFPIGAAAGHAAVTGVVLVPSDVSPAAEPLGSLQRATDSLRRATIPPTEVGGQGLPSVTRKSCKIAPANAMIEAAAQAQRQA